MNTNPFSKLLGPLKSGLLTGLFTFLGTLATLSVGWLQTFAQWTQAPHTTALPTISTIGHAVLAAGIGAFGGVVAFIARAAQAYGIKIPFLPTVAFGPTDPKAPVAAVPATTGSTGVQPAVPVTVTAGSAAMTTSSAAPVVPAVPPAADGGTPDPSV
jgi:hypothetical protein